MENGHRYSIEESTTVGNTNSEPPKKGPNTNECAAQNAGSTTLDTLADHPDQGGTTQQPMPTTSQPDLIAVSNSPTHLVVPHSADISAPTCEDGYHQCNTPDRLSVNLTSALSATQYSVGSYVSQPVPPHNYPSSMNMIAAIPEQFPPGAHPGYPSGVVVPQHVSPYLLHPRSVPYISSNSSPNQLHTLHTSAAAAAIPAANTHSPLVTTPSSILPNTDLIMPSVESTVPPTPLFLSSAASPVNAGVNPNDLAASATGPPGVQGGGDYYVMVHVDAGATFSVRVGDQIQHIPGPATVRMVSNSGPPIPMPMQVPAGHLVQQIVDEEGILKHVILSLYPGPTQPPPPPPSSATASTPPVPLNQPNGIVAQGSSVLLDPTHHLHAAIPPPAPGSHPAHHHHHPHLSHSSSSVPPGGAHLPVGGPISLCAYNYPHPQLTPPVSHYHSQFVHTPTMGPLPASQHFHPHQFMPTPPNPVCSTTDLRSAVDRGPLLNGTLLSSYPADQVLTESDQVNRVSAEVERNTGADQAPCANQLTNKTSTGVIENSTSMAADAQSASAGCPKGPENNSQLGPPDDQHRDSPSSEDTDQRQNGEEKRLTQSSTVQNSGSTQPTNGPVSRDSQAQQPRTQTELGTARNRHERTAPASCAQTEATRLLSSGHCTPNHTCSNDSHLTYSPTFGNSSRRRGRAGLGKTQGTFRSQARPNKFVSSTHSNSSLLNGSAPTNSFGSPSDAAESCATSPMNSTDSLHPRPSGGWSTDSNSHFGDSQRVSAHQPRAFSTPSPTVPYLHYRGRRSQPNYLLSNPSSSNTLDPTSRPVCSTLDHTVGRYLRTPHDLILSTPEKEIEQQQQQQEQAIDGDWECEAIQTVLSAIPAPQVSDIKSGSALIHLTLPTDLTVPSGPNTTESDLDLAGTRLTTDTKSDTASKSHGPQKTGTIQEQRELSCWSLDENAIQFELHLAERDSAARFNCLFVGEATDISLQDLRPGSDYYVKYCCVYSDIRGQFSSTVHFTTIPTEPSVPRNLTVLGHTRTSLHLKWSAASDNGSRITAYCLEYAPVPSNLHGRHPSWTSAQLSDRVNGDQIPQFVEGFHGLAKSCKLTQLNPSTEYLIRVMAKNAHGNSPWSSTITTSTSGSPPPTPHTPFLISADVHSLTLAWTHPDSPSHRATQSAPVVSLTYTLEMDDEAMGHGFVTVFDGSGTEHCVENLRRNTRYRFRLAASNTDGRSRWTEVVTFATLPDRPSAPRNLRFTSLIQPTRLDLAWDPPEDDGGLSVNAYRLEIRLPYVLPSKGAVVALKNTPAALDPTAPLDVDPTSPGITSESLFCWPHATGLPGKTSFGSLPPCVGGSLPIMPRLVSPTHGGDSPPQRYGNTRSSDVGPRRTPSGESASPPRLLDTCNAPLGDADSLVPDYSSLVSQPSLSTGSIHFGWFVVYEGPGSAVTIENLIPGLRLWFRVRARSSFASKTAGLSGGYIPSFRDLWGIASSPPLEVSLPAVPPPAPSFPPRLVGQAGPTSLHLSWQSPKNTGGSPIVAYEVWQMDLSSPRCTSDESDAESQSRVSPLRHQHSRSVSECSAVEGRGDMELDEYEDAPNKSGPERCSSLDSVLSKRVDCCCCCNCCLSNRKLGFNNPISAQGRLVCSVSGLECRVNGLRPGRSYAFRIRACNLIGRGPWSPWANISTAASPPGAPSRPPRLQPRTATTVHVSWDPVSRTNGSKVTEYWLEWQPLPSLLPYHVTTLPSQVHSVDRKSSMLPTGSPNHSDRDSNFQLLYTGPELTYELHGVQPASRLAFRVCALNSAGPGAWSPVGVCITPSTVPGQPSGLRIKQCLPHSVQVHWAMPQPNGSPVTSFTIELSTVNESFDANTSSPSIIVFDIPAPAPDTTTSSSTLATQLTDLEESLRPHLSVVEHRLDHLLPETSYKVRVRALNALGYGPFSASLSFTTLPLCPGPPRFTAPTMLTATSVRLQWCMSDELEATESPHPASCPRVSDRAKPLSHSNLQFVLQLSRQPDGDWNTIYDGPETVYKATRLTENTSYNFRVHAVNQTGPGAYSEVLSLSTLRLPPPVIRGLKVVDISTDVCQLEWSPVSLCGSDTIVYVVQLMPVLQSGAHSPQLSNVQAQVYRGTQTSCRLTDLVPNTDYLVRVCAIRLCLPNNAVASTCDCGTTISLNQPRLGNEVDKNEERSNTDGDWSRDPLDVSIFHVTELPGPYSHGLNFSTRPLRLPKNHPLDGGLSAQRDSVTRTSLNMWRWFPRVFRIPLRVIYSQSDPTLSSSSQAATAQTSTSPVTVSTLNNPSLRRRLGASNPVIQVPVSSAVAQSALSAKPSPHSTSTHHSAFSKRTQQWFRLSDRKLACLFLFLFALATLLVFMGLQHFLAAQPSTGSHVPTSLMQTQERLNRPAEFIHHAA
ncbi:hypothetical protein CRM22_011284 [Opisthorchis felineus]|uniref:Fibronectin type-III domain-containing protein n=1 Tax=Opisthorchis felineus TaxID=147828 RepID=A0A4S2JU51_OPIFE|nr:hypothetical protein CRM22_011284 [Opisthorchis felineus]